MTIVVKWREDGEYLSRLVADYCSTSLEWSRQQRDAIRFDSVSNALREIEAHIGRTYVPTFRASATFVRIVPRKRHASPQP